VTVETMTKSKFNSTLARGIRWRINIL
jgi:hypothetical protein